MQPTSKHTIQIGQLVTAAYDGAAALGGDDQAVSRRATEAIQHLLRSARRRSIRAPASHARVAGAPR